MLFQSVIPYSGFGFWFTFILFLASSRIFNSLQSFLAIKNLIMIFISLSVIAAVTENINIAAAILIISTIVFIIGKILIADLKHKNIKLGATIFILVLFLCYFKYAIIQTNTNKIVALFIDGAFILSPQNKHIYFIGISYFTFKFIHYLVDCRNKKIQESNFLTFINYITYFPSFFSGPINRYNQFSEDIKNPHPESLFSKCSVPGVRRIVSGLFKKIVLANSLLPYSIISIDPLASNVTTGQILLGVYAYMFYIYFDFAGYTDMAIGCSKLIGIHLPENFNSPFLKRNLQQFWANWHISLTTWLTDYIYWPIARKIRHFQYFKKKPVTLSNVSIIITFIVCGLWHGDGSNFLLWGLYHGIGLAILNSYILIERKYISNPWKKRINNSKVGFLLSLFITFQYVAVGFFIFGCDIGKMTILLKKIVI